MGVQTALLIDGYLVNGLFDMVGQIFVRSLKLLVVPLVFVSLVCGVSALGNSSRIGTVAEKNSLSLYDHDSYCYCLAIMIAVIVKPGIDIDLATASEFVAKDAPPLKDTIINIFPSNPVQSMAMAVFCRSLFLLY